MLFSAAVIQSLREGKLAVIPTDTLYGIVCSARVRQAVERLYAARGRAAGKPCIILIADSAGLQEFGIVVSEADDRALQKAWPGKVSVVFDCQTDTYAYLHRGTRTLAFRVPDDEGLRTLLRNTGPLLVPSANPAGQPPASTLSAARNYFGAAVVMYVDGGYRESLPSTVARVRSGGWEVLRQGAAIL